MTSEPSAQRRAGSIDRRLLGQVAIARRYLWVAVGIGLAVTACIVVQAVLLADVIDRALLHGARLGQVAPQLIGLAAVFGARAVVTAAGDVAAQRTSGRVAVDLRRRLLRHTLDLGPAWLAGERAGELSLTATRGIGALDAYFGRYLPQAVLAAIAPVAILAWVGATDWPSLLVLLALVACVPVAMVGFGRRARAASERQWRRLSSLSAHLLELVQGLPTLPRLRARRARPARGGRGDRRRATGNPAHVARRAALRALPRAPGGARHRPRRHGARAPPPPRDPAALDRPGRAARLPRGVPPPPARRRRVPRQHRGPSGGGAGARRPRPPRPRAHRRPAPIRNRPVRSAHRVGSDGLLRRAGGPRAPRVQPRGRAGRTRGGDRSVGGRQVHGDRRPPRLRAARRGPRLDGRPRPVVDADRAMARADLLGAPAAAPVPGLPRRQPPARQPRRRPRRPLRGGAPRRAGAPARSAARRPRHRGG